MHSLQPNSTPRPRAQRPCRAPRSSARVPAALRACRPAPACRLPRPPARPCACCSPALCSMGSSPFQGLHQFFFFVFPYYYYFFITYSHWKIKKYTYIIIIFSLLFSSILKQIYKNLFYSIFFNFTTCKP